MCNKNHFTCNIMDVKAILENTYFNIDSINLHKVYLLHNHLIKHLHSNVMCICIQLHPQALKKNQNYLV